MDLQLKINVYSSGDAQKFLLERIVKFNDACPPDFNTIMSSLRFLFGKNCVISFQIL